MPEYKRFNRKTKKAELALPQSEKQVLCESRITAAEQCRMAWREDFNVEGIMAAYEGRLKPDSWNNDEWFSINLAVGASRVLKRNVCPRELDVKLKLARSFVTDLQTITMMEQIIHLRTAVLRYMLESQKLPTEGQLAYLNALMQYGVLKVGYSADMEANPNAGKIKTTKHGQMNYDEEKGFEIEPPYQVKDETFFIDQVHPDCFLVDDMCGNDLDKDGHWCAQKWFRSVESVKEDPRFPASVVENLDASSLEDYERQYLEFNEQKKWKVYKQQSAEALPEHQLVVGYEIYDLRLKQTLTIIRGAKDIILKPTELPPGIATHPFIVLKFIERPGKFYPIPPMYNWMGPLIEYNITRNSMAVYRKRTGRKYLIKRGAINTTEIEKLRSAEDGIAVIVDQDGAIEVLKDPPMNQENYVDVRMLRDEFMESTGVGQNQRGTAGSESATEAEIVERRAREGEVDEHEDMMVFLGDVMKKLHDSVEANLTKEGAVNDIGPGGANWVAFGPEHFEKISGEIIFNVTASEEGRMTLQVERAQLLQLLDLLGKNPMLALNETLLRAVTDLFPAIADNELLIYNMQQMAVMSMQMQLAAQSKGQPGAAQPGGTTTGDVASDSRQVGGGN